MKRIKWMVLALSGTLLCGSALAHTEGHDAAKPKAGATPATAPASGPAVQTLDGSGTRDARAYFTDTDLLTQDGKQVQFYSDVLKDKVVVINVVFTNCEDACPLITRKLKEVRDGLGEPLARKVHFVSITSDPERDTPQSLKDFAGKNEADDPNWTFLTGSRANIDAVLTRLGQLSRSPEEHSTLLIAGDVANKRWSKIRPDAPPAAIVERLRLLAEPLVAAGK